MHHEPVILGKSKKRGSLLQYRNGNGLVEAAQILRFAQCVMLLVLFDISID